MASYNKSESKDSNAAYKNEPSANELANQVEVTRSAITSDIKELSGKLSPSQLKEEAKGVGKEFAVGVKDVVVDKAAEVKDVVVDKAVEVKDAVIDKAVEVKDAIVEKTAEATDAAVEKLGEAKEAMSEAIDDAGETAARIGRATWRFTSANAVPLALVGIGAGWMIASNRGSARPRTDIYSRPSRRRNELSRPRDVRSAAWEPTGDESMIQSGKNTAIRGAKLASEGFQRAKEASSDFVDANPLAVAMATLALGVGVGLLLPTTERENKWLAPARDKFDRLVGEAREATSDVVEIAKETASESLSRS